MFGLSGGSLFGSSFSFSLCSSFGLGSSSTLSGNCSSTGFVHFLFAFQTGFGNIAAVGLDIALYTGDFGILSFLPFVEFGIGLSLADSTLCNTNLEVMFQKNAFIGEYATAGVAGLCAVVQPFNSLVHVDVDLGGIGQRIVGAKSLNKFSISRCTTIRYDDVIKRLILFTLTL